ncbi:hypothetical protein PGTUg99_012469 [Puccinia graminis f. sp. tritici]|uniref:Uncharacterized protein n=1 Tax=Puccinia graminis f. sp. tritici TaxID=56615 RepID=A0A5B0S5I6_PUCGR|nr:hypothetical protein PGTUg99_012469 [Puccinia graminis f. sp. tritici]
MYLASWKGFLPAVEVHVPRRPEGSPSCRRGTRTSSTGRKSFRPTRYMYLADWKEALPVNKVHVPRRLEGSPSSQRSTCTSPAGRKSFQPAISSFRPRVSLGIPGYPPGFHGKGGIRTRIRTRQRISPGTGGYPPADSGYPRRIIPAHLYALVLNTAVSDQSGLNLGGSRHAIRPTNHSTQPTIKMDPFKRSSTPDMLKRSSTPESIFQYNPDPTLESR